VPAGWACALVQLDRPGVRVQRGCARAWAREVRERGGRKCTHIARRPRRRTRRRGTIASQQSSAACTGRACTRRTLRVGTASRRCGSGYGIPTFVRKGCAHARETKPSLYTTGALRCRASTPRVIHARGGGSLSPGPAQAGRCCSRCSRNGARRERRSAARLRLHPTAGTCCTTHYPRASPLRVGGGSGKSKRGMVRLVNNGGGCVAAGSEDALSSFAVIKPKATNAAPAPKTNGRAVDTPACWPRIAMAPCSYG
jgi:hypothetical protein